MDKIFKNDNLFLKLREKSLLIVTLYFLSFFVYRDFGVRIFYGYSLLSIFILMMSLDVLIDHKINVSKSKMPFMILSIIVFLIFILPSSLKDKQNVAYIIVMLIMLSMTILGKNNKKDIVISLSMIYVFAILLSFYIVFFHTFKEVYWDSVYLLLSPTAKLYATKYFFNGYSVSIGGITYTLYVLVLGLLVALTRLLFSNIGKIEKAFNILLILILSFVILISGRRGELLALIISLAIYYLISGNKTERIKRFKILFWVTLISFCAIIVLFPYLSEISFLHRYTMTFKALLYGEKIEGGVLSGRTKLYSIAWKLFKENPILGIGHGKFAMISADSYLSSEGKGMDVHNILLQLLAETGIVGTLFVLSVPLYIYYKTFMDTLKIWNEGEKHEVVMVSNSISLIIQTFIIIVSLIDPINYKIIFWALYFICFYLYIYSHLKIHNYEEVYEINFGNKHINRRKRKILNKIE